MRDDPLSLRAGLAAAIPGPAAAKRRRKTATAMPAITQATFPAATASPLVGRGALATWSIAASGAAMAFAYDAASEPTAVPVSAMLPAPGRTLVLHLTTFNDGEDALSFIVDGGEHDPETGIVTWTGVMQGEASSGSRSYGSGHVLRNVHIAVFPPVG